MSLNLSKALVDVCSDITLVVNVKQLGPRQQATLQHMLRTGVLKGDSVPATIAVAMRKRAGLPTIWYRRYSFFSWHNMAADRNDFFDRLKAAHVAHQLHTESKWLLTRYETVCNVRPADGGVHYGKSKGLLVVMNALPLPPYEWSDKENNTITINAKDLHEANYL